ncbi:MAG: TIGR01177 family methyltransferase, partial [Thermoplasmata archaeon]
MDRYIIEFSREPNDAKHVEIKSIMETYGDFQIEYIDDYIALINGNPQHLKNAAFINFISKVIYEGEKIEDLKYAKIPDGKFYVRVSGEYDDRENAEKIIGDLLTARGRVSFSDPDFVIRAIYKNGWFLSILYFKRDTAGFESRKAPLRPYFSPVSMHPKYARFLVNSAHVREGETILDPFCGTGGVLIEAAMIGIKI